MGWPVQLMIVELTFGIVTDGRFHKNRLSKFECVLKVFKALYIPGLEPSSEMLFDVKNSYRYCQYLV